MIKKLLLLAILCLNAACSSGAFTTADEMSAETGGDEGLFQPTGGALATGGTDGGQTSTGGALATGGTDGGTGGGTGGTGTDGLDCSSAYPWILGEYLWVEDTFTTGALFKFEGQLYQITLSENQSLYGVLGFDEQGCAPIQGPEDACYVDMQNYGMSFELLGDCSE